MITAAQIARFRGISDLMVEEFSRVNLIIGRNDCGKTALMEALQIGDDLPGAAHHLLRGQRNRLGRNVRTFDLDQFWRPLFFNLNAEFGMSIGVANEKRGWNVLEVRQGPPPDEIFSEEDILQEDESLPERPSWSLELRLRSGSIEKPLQRIVATPNRIRLPPLLKSEESYWISSASDVGPNQVRYVSELKQKGQDRVLLELLREVDGRLSSIELLAPSGSTAELFVRLDKNTPLLPVALMGEGFQRCIELGAAAAAHNWPTMFIDEIENGIHHLVMEPLWRWIATISKKRNLQVFATTHSEECIHAACRAFSELGDEGLRVIRLDRLETGTRTGTEIRG
jgi:AAA domain, putative AbiEii toxin, Type IV TA system